MSLIIKCPNCSYEFPLDEALSAEQKENYNKELNEMRQKMKEFMVSKENEFKAKETALEQALVKQEEGLRQTMEAAYKKLEKEKEDTIRKQLLGTYENQLKLLQQNASDNEEKLKIARQNELEYLKKEQALKSKEAEIEILIEKQLIAGREKMKMQLLQEEQGKNDLREQQYTLRKKELEKQLEDQKKLVDELKRKSEQGSMQLQGEVQELILEEMLRQTFPFDTVQEVGKGVKGADCIQTVRNNTGQDAGSIIYESKRTKEFTHEWIEKLKSDMRSQGADAAVIVSQVMPKDMDRFGEKNGVYICSFTEVRSVALLLRNAILKFAELKKSQENKGDKMVMLYDYLIGLEFKEQWNAIREGFSQMKQSIQRERDAMEKLWKAREKQLEKVLLNAAHIKGSIEGISGADTLNLSLTDEGDYNYVEE